MPEKLEPRKIPYLEDLTEEQNEDRANAELITFENPYTDEEIKKFHELYSNNDEFTLVLERALFGRVGIDPTKFMLISTPERLSPEHIPTAKMYGESILTKYQEEYLCKFTKEEKDKK